MDTRGRGEFENEFGEKKISRDSQSGVSRGAKVIVDDATKNFFSLDRAIADRMLWKNRCALLDALMGAREVVIGHKLNEDTLQMSGAEDQDVIQAFLTGSSDPAFCVRICVRRPEGGVNDVVAFRNENSIKGVIERAVIVVDQETKGASFIHKIPN